MILGELDRAVDRGELSTARCSCGTPSDFFTAANVDRYLAAADAGKLSIRPVKKHSNTLRVRRTVLRRFLASLGVSLAVPNSPVTGPPDSPTEDQLRALWRYVASTSTNKDPSARHAHVRRAAIVAVAVAAGTRIGELLALTLDDLADGPNGMTLTVSRNDDVPEEVLMTPPARNAILRWLRVRQEVTAPLEGADDGSLFVAVKASYRTFYKPAGLRVSSQAVEDSVRMAVSEVNRQQQKVPGWQAMPTTLDWLRQADRSSDNSKTAAGAPLGRSTENPPASNGGMATPSGVPTDTPRDGQLTLFEKEVSG